MQQYVAHSGVERVYLFSERIERAEHIDWGSVPLDGGPSNIGVLGRKLQLNDRIVETIEVLPLSAVCLRTMVLKPMMKTESTTKTWK